MSEEDEDEDEELESELELEALSRDTATCCVDDVSVFSFAVQKGNMYFVNRTLICLSVQLKAVERLQRLTFLGRFFGGVKLSTDVLQPLF